jgi:eukaryotic-like serine/threonine-protein kinase
VEALTALFAQLLGRLYGLTAPGVCPGGWPWAVSLLGVGVGLLPALGAAGIALWRRRIGSRYGPGASVVLAGTGLVTAGLVPLVVFLTTGKVFSAAVGAGRVAGLTARQQRSLDTAVCVAGPQSRYLGAGSVVEALQADEPVRTGLAALVLVALPLVAALFTLGSARLATRRGPHWPVRWFWLPVLGVAVATGGMPAGSAGHLWLGVVAGAFLGMPLVLVVGAPNWAVVQRSVVPRSGSRSGSRPGSPSGSPSAAPADAPRPGSTPADGPGGWGNRLAARFAAREPEPVVGLPPAEHTGSAGPPDRPPVGPRGTAVFGAPTGPGRPGATPPAPRPSGPARFRLVRQLGSGGFGGVWLAHDARLGQTVALKAAHMRDTDTEERIRREAQALAAVHHPNCVRILDLVPADDDPGLATLDGLVIVMEYVRGESLGERVRARGTVDDVTAARVWSSIASALDAAHGRGVLHRDVKPANVIVDADGRAHLIDFGIARRTGDATLTAAGFVLGTPDYLAPEVAAGGSATPESDAWQLAATVGYALSGHPPRGEYADAVSALRAAAVGGPLTHLPARSAHLALLRAALDADPTRRPSPRAVVRTLDAWLRSAGVRPDGPVAGSVASGPGAR